MSEDKQRSEEDIMRDFESVCHRLLRNGWADRFGEGADNRGVVYTATGFEKMTQLRDLLREFQPRLRPGELSPLMVLLEGLDRCVVLPPEDPEH